MIPKFNCTDTRSSLNVQVKNVLAAWTSDTAELLLKCGCLGSVDIFRELLLPRFILSSDKPLTLGKLHHSVGATKEGIIYIRV